MQSVDKQQFLKRKYYRKQRAPAQLSSYINQNTSLKNLSIRYNMPGKKRNYKKRSSAYRKRKLYKKKPMTTSIVKMPTLLPDRMLIKMVYQENTNNTLTVPANQRYGIRQFYGNAIYDPDTYIGNRGCYGYKEWSAFYNKYRVSASKIIIKAINRTQGQVYRVSVFPADQSVNNASTLTYAASQPYAKSKYCSILGTEPTLLKNYMTTVRMEGDKGAKFDISFASSYNDNPKNLWYWDIVAETLNNESDSETGLYIDVQIVYYVELYSRRDLSLNAVSNVPIDDPIPSEPEYDNGATGRINPYFPPGSTGGTIILD